LELVAEDMEISLLAHHLQSSWHLIKEYYDLMATCELSETWCIWVGDERTNWCL